MTQDSKNMIEVPGKFVELSEWAQTARPSLLNERRRRSAELPLRYWNQQAHFTTPASGTPEKAIKGLVAVPKILKRFGISPADIAARTGIQEGDIESLLNQENKHSPFVMVDAEDAVAFTEESSIRARTGAVRCFTEEDWGTTLPFFRPGGLELQSCVDDLMTVLPHVAEGRAPEDFPIAGIVWPKVEHPAELEWVCEMLNRIERELNLEANQIKLEFLIESGHALAHLKDLVDVCVHRLVGLIWGIADYSADTNLPSIENAHPVCDWARYEIVNMAGALNVPAIDNMTLNYPTPVHRGSDLSEAQQAENKDKIMGSLDEVYQDAVHGINLGMTGKWVGHPAQLFMVLLAYRNAIPKSQIEKDLKDIDAYTASVEAGAGATMLGDGREQYMADRATDRHLRARLRRATAWGALDGKKAHGLGIISDDELAQLG